MAFERDSLISGVEQAAPKFDLRKWIKETGLTVAVFGVVAGLVGFLALKWLDGVVTAAELKGGQNALTLTVQQMLTQQQTVFDSMQKNYNQLAEENTALRKEINSCRK